MDEMKEAVGNWREAKQFSPADENDFLRWLDKADTEEKLFSRLTFWFTFRGLPADQNQRYHLVQERARELRLWNGLELKLRRWQDRVADEYEQIGKEAFAARIGEDYADYINSLTDPEAAPQQAAPEPETAKPAGVQAWSARELSEMELPPIRHVVEGLLPMGMGVLVAKPKLGKSWMVLDLCLAVAQGEPFLGFPTRQHGTLYLALEDGKSRMQTRLRRLLEGRPAPANMHVMFQAQRLGEGLLETLGEYLDANPDIHLVCIDTLSKIKPKAKPFENAYDADYDYMGRLKAFADSRGICVLLVHHTRKSTRTPRTASTTSTAPPASWVRRISPSCWTSRAGWTMKQAFCSPAATSSSASGSSALIRPAAAGSCRARRPSWPLSAGWPSMRQSPSSRPCGCSCSRGMERGAAMRRH